MEYDEEKDAMRELLTLAAVDLLSSETQIAKLAEELELAKELPEPQPRKKRRATPHYGPYRR